VIGGQAFVSLVEVGPVVVVVAHTGKDCHIPPYVRPARNLAVWRSSVRVGQQVVFDLEGLLHQTDSSCIV
jgi:hypothetical protein